MTYESCVLSAAHMDAASLQVKKLPTIGIFVRHSRNCSTFGKKGNEHHNKCKCWKWLRWRENGKLHREPTNCRDLTGAERAKADVLKKWTAAASGMPIQNKSTTSVAKGR